MDKKRRLIVGISGASGSLLAVDLLEEVKRHPDWEIHLVYTKGAAQTLTHETDFDASYLESLADCFYDNEDIGAAIASGTYPVEGMVVIPCSMKTVAGIAMGYSENLLLRAADVTIKERRPLVLVARESPLSPIHLDNMSRLASLGVWILPPVLTLYHRPQTVAQLIQSVTARALHPFGIHPEGFRCWGESANWSNITL